MADYTTPSRFLETILSGPLDGRRKLYRRLGLAARDPIDELMTAALEFERNEIPSLDRFHAWFARGDVEIQRDPSQRANAVRVMTVHGAKGLEAPYVILADATADPANLGRRNPPLDLPVGGEKVPVIRPRKAELVEPFTTIARRAGARARGALAAALRRHDPRQRAARRRRHRATRGVPENSWYRRVERALASLQRRPRTKPWGTWRAIPARSRRGPPSRASSGPWHRPCPTGRARRRQPKRGRRGRGAVCPRGRGRSGCSSERRDARRGARGP